MRIGHVVISKPVIGGVRVMDNEPSNMHMKVKEAIRIKLRTATIEQNRRV